MQTLENTAESGLRVRDITVKFGGLVAVDNVSLNLAPSEILCIIGPNGAGKSTLFNLISGIYKPTAGTVALDGETLTGLPVYKVAKKGIARTFQSSRLFADLTVLDNVIIGMHGQTRTGVLGALLTPGRARRELNRAAEVAQDLLRLMSEDLWAMRNALASTLPQADRRRLEIARALASRPKVIMLDEPSSGMDDKDTDALLDDIHKVMAERAGLSFLIIEHDMRLVGALPERVAVIDYGRKIAEGSFETVRSDPHVQEAYLGYRATHS